MTQSTMLSVATDDLFTDPEVRTLAGFLGGYSGLTRDAYALDLRQFAQWCHDRNTGLFAVRRGDIEAFARHLEDLGRARATISRRLCTITSLYRYAVEEGLLDRSPAVHVRRPRLDYESNATGLDRNEVGAMLVAAGLAGARDHALISLLALNGLRVSEAIGADIDQLGLERGHRTLVIHRKGGKTVTIPLAPRTARAVDLAVGERCQGPIFCDRAGNRLDRHGAARIVRRIARRAGIYKRVGPTRFDMRSSPPRSTPVSHCATSKRPRATQTRAPRCATTAPECRSTGTPPTSCRPSSPAPPGSQNCPLRARQNERGAGNMRWHCELRAVLTRDAGSPDWVAWSCLPPDDLMAAVQAFMDDVQRGLVEDVQDAAMAAFPRVLRVFWLLDWLRYEVLQNGFSGYLYNSHGRNAAEAATALAEIGATSTAMLVRAAIDRGALGEHLDALDAAFYADREGWEELWADYTARAVAARAAGAPN